MLLLLVLVGSASPSRTRTITVIYCRCFISRRICLCSKYFLFTTGPTLLQTWTIRKYGAFVILNKVKEVIFKMIHRFYPSKTFLQRYKKDIDVNSSFCQLDPVHLCNLFRSCSFWQDICTFISQHIDSDFDLSYENVLFGHFTHHSTKTNQCCIINFIAKSHIHKSKLNPSYFCQQFGH